VRRDCTWRSSCLRNILWKIWDVSEGSCGIEEVRAKMMSKFNLVCNDLNDRSTRLDLGAGLFLPAILPSRERPPRVQRTLDC
jgi:hypothetical protein